MRADTGRVDSNMQDKGSSRPSVFPEIAFRDMENMTGEGHDRDIIRILDRDNKASLDLRLARCFFSPKGF